MWPFAHFVKKKKIKKLVGKEDASLLSYARNKMKRYLGTLPRKPNPTRPGKKERKYIRLYKHGEKVVHTLFPFISPPHSETVARRCTPSTKHCTHRSVGFRVKLNMFNRKQPAHRRASHSMITANMVCRKNCQICTLRLCHHWAFFSNETIVLDSGLTVVLLRT